jgi:phosphate acetyltransferase
MDTLLKDPVLAATVNDAEFIENIIYDELDIGRSASVTRVVSQNDIDLFAAVSGDVNPAHLDTEYANASMFHGVIAHGMLSGSLFSTILGTVLPGPGTIYLRQDLKFRRPVKPGDVVTATVIVRQRDDEKKRVVLDCVCTNQDGKEVVIGEAEVLAPTEKVRRLRMDVPEVRMVRHDAQESLMAKARGGDAIPTAVVHPCDHDSLQGALDGARAGFIRPILVGPWAKITEIASIHGLDLADVEIVDALHSHDAAEKAVALVRAGRAAALMKGNLHTDELLHEVMRKDCGLRTGRRVSHYCGGSQEDLKETACR